MRVDDVLVRVNDTRIHYEVSVINVMKVFYVQNCSE